MIRKLSLPGLFFFLLIISCQNTNRQPEQIVDDSLTGLEQAEEVKAVYYRFPSPDEMLHIIDQEKINFNDEIIHSTNYAKSYLDSKSQALNLGIYLADMAYVSLFQRPKEALIYLHTIYGLSDKLRISSAFEPGDAKRVEENIDNIDSLKVYADEALTRITNYLVREEKEKVLAIISIGGFIESLYLAFHVAGEYSEDNIIIQRIADQKMVLENLLNYCLEYAGDNSVSDAITLIHPLRDIYTELVVSKNETSVSRDDQGKLIISGGDRVLLDKAKYEELKEATYIIRRKIIENLEN